MFSVLLRTQSLLLSVANAAFNSATEQRLCNSCLSMKWNVLMKEQDATPHHLHTCPHTIMQPANIFAFSMFPLSLVLFLFGDSLAFWLCTFFVRIINQYCCGCCDVCTYIGVYIKSTISQVYGDTVVSYPLYVHLK